MVLSVALFDSSAGLARGLGPDEFGLVRIVLVLLSPFSILLRILDYFSQETMGSI